VQVVKVAFTCNGSAAVYRVFACLPAEPDIRQVQITGKDRYRYEFKFYWFDEEPISVRDIEEELRKHLIGLENLQVEEVENYGGATSALV